MLFSSSRYAFHAPDRSVRDGSMTSRRRRRTDRSKTRVTFRRAYKSRPRRAERALSRLASCKMSPRHCLRRLRLLPTYCLQRLRLLPASVQDASTEEPPSPLPSTELTAPEAKTEAEQAVKRKKISRTQARTAYFLRLIVTVS